MNGNKSYLRQLRILCHIWPQKKSSEAEETLTLDELRKKVLSGKFLKLLFHYKQVTVLIHSHTIFNIPWRALFIIRLLSLSPIQIHDSKGYIKALSIPLLFHTGLRYLIGLALYRTVLLKVKRELGPRARQLDSSNIDFLPASYPPLYVRSNLWFGVESGGSVGHTAGIINHLSLVGTNPEVLSTDDLPLIDETITVHRIKPNGLFWDLPEIETLDFNFKLMREGRMILKSRRFSFIYHRYSLHSFAVARLALEFQLPLVLEFNGPESWMARHWGTPLRQEKLADQIELYNLRHATLVVVVSTEMKRLLLDRGISEKKILVLPNGVDELRYSPSIDGTEVRNRLGISDGDIVIGFSGTFQKWHGAHVLVDAFCQLVERNQSHINIHLLLIGDGPELHSALEIARNRGCLEKIKSVGLIPQDQTPCYLAACDIFSCPTLNNADGTEFFGSPTKLFEYMSMGKAVVCSAVGQMKQLFADSSFLQLVPPNDANSLSLAIQSLVDNSTRRMELGLLAREHVSERYSWQKHTKAIINRLKELIPASIR